MPDGTSTHDVELGPDQVIKPFRCWDRGEPAREWGALLLLNEFAPGLAPAPLEVDLAGDPVEPLGARLSGLAEVHQDRTIYAKIEDVTQSLLEACALGRGEVAHKDRVLKTVAELLCHLPRSAEARLVPNVVAEEIASPHQRVTSGL